MKTRIIMLTLFLTLTSNSIHAGIGDQLKDLGIGCAAGITTSFVIRACDGINTQHQNSLKSIAGLTTAFLTLRYIKDRKDINHANLLFCILSTISLSASNLWDRVFGPKSAGTIEIDSDEDEEGN
jgi:hypothetical protein